MTQVTRAAERVVRCTDVTGQIEHYARDECFELKDVVKLALDECFEGRHSLPQEAT